MTRLMSRICTSAVALLALIVVVSPGVRAQAVYGSIAGTVVDSTGAAVSRATVTITSVERKTVDTVVTNDSGLLREGAPAPRHLRGEGRAHRLQGQGGLGRERERRHPDQGRPRARGRRDDRGRHGRLGREPAPQDRPRRRGDDLRHRAARPSCRSSTATSPSSSCSPRAPQQQSWNHAASENPQGSAQTVVNGQTFSGTGYQLDGTENRDPILGIIVINPTLESIGETKITSQNYDAEFGQAIAGVVSVQTKSGTNEYPRQRLRVPAERQLPGPEPLHTTPRRTRSPDAYLPESSATSSAGRSAVRS